MNKKFYTILFLFLSFLCILTLTGCQSLTQKANTQDNWAKITKNKKVTIGLDITFVPMGYENKHGNITGFDVDLAKAVFKKYNIKPIFQPIDWSMNVTELRNGTIDLIWNGFSETPERKKNIAFTNPYLSNEQELVTLKSSHINNFNDMHNKVLGAQSGSSGLNDINNNPKVLKDKIKNNSPILYNSFTNAFIDLTHGRIDGLLIDSNYANYYIAHQSDPSIYAVSTGKFPDEKFSVGLRKGDKTMRNKINKGLRQLAKDGELKKICRKWFANNYKSPLLKLEKQSQKKEE